MNDDTLNITLWFKIRGVNPLFVVEGLSSTTSSVAGQCFIPASQRPDGTWRKARRVKDGYIPQEEMPLYESKGKQWAKTKSDHPVGLAPEDVSAMKSRRQAGDSSIPGLVPAAKLSGMSKSQKKKAAAAKKKANATDAEISKSLEETHISNSTAGGRQEVASDPTKRLRNLKKKLRDIEKLERQIASGDIKNPEPEQLEKVKRKEEVVQQIEELEQETTDED
ncbi:Partner of Y14 and mago [Chionoecetes opilio]|uniref:Partner of Y14 and mago n=1 Tax=Chionoecetes opilio TaxID=41210 RepID=A0A8J5CU58_CHIOP|nr:Partner of Y14 and mago [Chionoecetes opilio]